MKVYELSYIVSPELTSEEAEAKGKEIESAIQSREGNVFKQSNPIAKTFSHPVGKRASGFWGVIEFHLEPEKLLELKAIIEKDEKIVRHMIIIKKAAELKKERRTKGGIKTKLMPAPELEVKVETKIEKEEKQEVIEPEEESSSKKKAIKEKVELKDIEHELDEILGE